MNILIVCATQFEVKPLLDFLEVAKPVQGMNMPRKQLGETEVSVLITGVGMVNTAYYMGLIAIKNFDLALNVGVCGAFDRSLALGEVVHITKDTLSELGAEDGESFLTYDQLGLPGKSIFNASLNEPFSKIDNLLKVKGITVNTVHGNEHSIERIKQLYAPDVESMEGAAFYAGSELAGKNSLQVKLQNNEGYATVSYPPNRNYTQVRAVSNYVEKRDKSKWQMPLAIKNLNDFLIDFIKDL